MNIGAFRALTKDNMLQPYISYQEFGSSNARVVNVGYDLFVFDIQFHEKLTASVPTKLEC